MSKSTTLPPEIVEFATQVGDFIEYWGFKNFQGQIWAYLYLSEQPIDRAELIRRTGISKGLASIYIKEMLEYGVIKEIGRGPNGVTLYEAEENQDHVIFNVLRRREQAMISKVSAALEQCKAISTKEKLEAGISEDGIKKAESLVSSASTIMNVLIRSHDSIQNIVARIKKGFT